MMPKVINQLVQRIKREMWFTCGQNCVILPTPSDCRMRISTCWALHLNRISFGSKQRLGGTIRNNRRTTHRQHDISINVVNDRQHHLAGVQTSICLLDVLDLQSVCWRCLIESHWESRILNDQRTASGQENRIRTLFVGCLHPVDRKLGCVMYGAFQFDGASNVFDLFLCDVRNRWRSLRNNQRQRCNKGEPNHCFE